MESKKWWSSKTIWGNIIGIFIAPAVKAATGFEIPADMQLWALGGVNLVLRIVTKGPVEW